MTRPFREIAAARLAEPTDRALIDAEVRAILASLGLAELRIGRGATQTDVARVLGPTQENVSRIERRDDVHLSTLGRYVAASRSTQFFPTGPCRSSP